MKKWIALLVVVLAVVAGLIVYLQVPRPVVSDPEGTVLERVTVETSAEDGSKETFVWVPETEEQKETAKKIVEYLSQTKEKRTFYKDTIYSASWRLIYIVLGDAYGERVVVLAPGEPDDPQWAHSMNISCMGLIYGKDYALPDYLRQFQGKLLDPDGIRTFVLDSLGLSTD